MISVKDLIVKPIAACDANSIISKLHYSGKVVPNSQLHFGVFLNGRCGGAMQFGPSLCKKLTINLVKNTNWNGFIELNRLAFADWLPKNSESRCLGYAIRFIKKQYPHIKWILSFADATQCGDGAIYRASGFILTGIKKNKSLRLDPKTNKPIHIISAYHRCLAKEFKKYKPIEGYQLRYIYFLDRSIKDNLTVSVIPFAKIDELGIGMYRGKSKRATSIGIDASVDQTEEGGASPTVALQIA